MKKIYLNILLFTTIYCFLQPFNFGQNGFIDIKSIESVKEVDESYCYSWDSTFLCNHGYWTCIKVRFDSVFYNKIDNSFSLSGSIVDCFDTTKIISNSQILIGEFTKSEIDISIDSVNEKVCGATINISNRFAVNEYGDFQITFMLKDNETICFTFSPVIKGDEVSIEIGAAEIFYLYKLLQ